MRSGARNRAGRIEIGKLFMIPRSGTAVWKRTVGGVCGGVGKGSFLRFCVGGAGFGSFLHFRVVASGEGVGFAS